MDIRDADADEPLSALLTQHGPIARRRCLIRAQLLTVACILVTAIAARFAPAINWPVAVALDLVVATVAVLLGLATYRNLGHARSGEHLIAGSGTLDRRRTALEIDGVIGWVVQQTWFQRRVGLATLVATTAAGSESVQIRNIAYPTAITFAHDLTPGMLMPFLETDAPSTVG